MLPIELTIGVLPLSGIALATFAAGFLLRGAQLRSSRKKIIELEREMLANHADILELQKEKATLLRQMRESKIPVIAMNTAIEDGDKTRKAR